jgi:hypothetical protein
MKLHYISCHSVLEYDEVKLFTEMGIDVFANGAYRDPAGAYTLPRPGIPGAVFHKDFFELSAQYPQTQLPDELIDPFDAIMVMWAPDVLIQNWPRIKHKKVILRTIGQSTPSWEIKLQPLVKEGLQIVRYSPMERNILNYAGENALIRFYKDPEEFRGWVGEKKRVINFTQSLLGRRYFCHYDEIMAATEGFDRIVYGVGNNDLGELNGGELPYEKAKEEMRANRVFFYGGTWPASYTLGFIEAWMTGIPIVAIGRSMAESDRFEKFNFYEIPNLIDNGMDGFYAETIGDLKNYIDMLMKKPKLATSISRRGRNKAISIFGKDKIKKEWQDYFKKL